MNEMERLLRDTMDDIERLLRDREPWPWHRRTWHKLYRVLETVRYFPRRVKWFIQRGRRGWSDHDLWGFDNYLSQMIPDALRRLKVTKHGIPPECFDPGIDWYHPLTEAQKQTAQNRWNLILDQMIMGFDAWQRLLNCDYDDEIPVSELNRRDAEIALMARDHAIFDEGMVLFAKHFGSLWH